MSKSRLQCKARRGLSRRQVPAVILSALAAPAVITRTARAANPKVILGAGVDATYGAIFVGVDKGFFAKQGLDAEYKTFEAGGMSIDAAAAGTVQVGGAGELPGLKPVSDGARIVYVATGLYSGRSGGVGVVAGIKKPSDLIGKKVAVLKGSTGELFQTLFFSKFALDGKVDVVNVAVPEMIPAMGRGDVQAIFVWEPWLTRLTETVPGTSVPWHYDTDGVYELHWGYWFNKDFIDRSPDVAQRTIAGLIAASDWIKANNDAAAEIISRPTRTPTADILKQMADLRYTLDLRKEAVDFYVTKIVPFAVSHGLIKTSDPAAFVKTFFYPELLRKVAPDRTDL